MINLLKLELFKLRHNPHLLVLICVTIFLGLFSTGMKYSSYPQVYEEIGTDIELYDNQQAYFSNQYFDEESFLLYVGVFYGKEFLTLDDFYTYIDGDFIKFIVFPDIMSNSFITYSACFLFPAFYLFRDFKKRASVGSIISGHSRISILGSRIIFYYSAVILVELLITLIALTFYGKKWASIMPADYLFRCLAMKVLLVCGTLSVPLLIAFLTRRPSLAAVITLFYSVFSALFNRSITTFATSSISFFAPSIQATMPVWNQDAPSTLILQSILWPLFSIVVCVGGSYAVYRRLDLQ